MIPRRRPCASDVAFYLPTVSRLIADGAAGGAESQILLLARALAASGVRVALIALPHDQLPEMLDGVRIVQRPATKAHQRGVGKLREAARIHRAIVAAGAPVVVGRMASPEVALVAFAAKISRRRFVYSSASLLDFSFIGKSLRPQDALLYRLALRSAQEIVVQTKEQAESCYSAIGRRPIVIQSIAERAPRQVGTPSAFVWAGRLEPNKRPMEYVALAEKVPEAMFRMVAVPAIGHDALGAQVQDASARISNLEVLTPRSREALGALIDHAVAVVSTSEYEGLPNVFLEGWARGVPALSLSHDPDGVIERHGLGYCAGGDRCAFAGRARELWAERERRDAIGARCRGYVGENHASEAVSALWRRVLEDTGLKQQAVPEASTC